jgi:hypothetical protein
MLLRLGTGETPVRSLGRGHWGSTPRVPLGRMTGKWRRATIANLDLGW